MHMILSPSVSHRLFSIPICLWCWVCFCFLFVSWPRQDRLAITTPGSTSHLQLVCLIASTHHLLHLSPVWPPCLRQFVSYSRGNQPSGRLVEKAIFLRDLTFFKILDITPCHLLLPVVSVCVQLLCLHQLSSLPSRIQSWVPASSLPDLDPLRQTSFVVFLLILETINLSDQPTVCFVDPVPC